MLFFELPCLGAAAAAKSLHLCLTLCDPIDSSPPHSPVSGILQARTLEWVAFSFSSAWKWKVKVKPFSRVRLLVTPWAAAYQAPPMGFSRQEYWSELPLPYPLLRWTRSISSSWLPVIEGAAVSFQGGLSLSQVHPHYSWFYHDQTRSGVCDSSQDLHRSQRQGSGDMDHQSWSPEGTFKNKYCKLRKVLINLCFIISGISKKMEGLPR